MKRDEIPPELHANIPANRNCPGSSLAFESDLTDKSNRNSCSVAYWQAGEDNFHLKAALLIVESLLKEPCFSTLRTTKQLGYIVFSALWSRRHMLGYFILVQSHVCAPAGLSGHITEFIAAMRKIISELSEELFAKHKNSVLKSVTKRNVSLEEEFAQYAAEMLSFDHQFDRREKLAQATVECTIQSVQTAFERTFLTENKRIDFEFVSTNLLPMQEQNNSSQPQRRKFRSIPALKQALPTHPSVPIPSKL